MKKLAFLLGFLLVLNSCNREDDILDIQEGESDEFALSESLFNRLKIPYHPIKIFLDTKTWMNQLDDDTQLKDITLVGSHDAGAYKRGGSLVETQESDIKTQLESGVRYLDIRLNYNADNKSLMVYHGIVSQHLDFANDVLKVVSDFLRKNPSEMVFLVVKNEGGKYPKEWKSKIEQEFSKYSSQIMDHYTRSTPLKFARGKMAIISRAGYLDYGKNLWGYDDNAATFGYLGGERTFFSDKYYVSTILPVSIHDKASVVFDGIYKAQQRVNEDTWMIINANGSSAFAHPISVASRINPMLANYLTHHIYQPYQASVPANFVAKRSGIIVIDFATSKEGKRIIDLAIVQSLLANSKKYQRRYNRVPGYIN